MSQTTEIIIHSLNMGIGDAIEEILRDETDAYHHGPWDEPDVTNRDGHLWFVTIETKWSVDGIDNAAVRMSREFACEVHLAEAWNDRDADEPGSRSVVYEHGAPVSEGRELQVPAGAGEVVAIPREHIAEWLRLLTEQPVPEIDTVVHALRSWA